MAVQDTYYVLVAKTKDGDDAGFISSYQSTCVASPLAKDFYSYDAVIEYVETHRKTLFDIFPGIKLEVSLVTTTVTAITEYTA